MRETDRIIQIREKLPLVNMFMRHLPYERADRVANQLHKVVAELCMEEVADPRLKDIRITHVRVTKDLQIARIYFFVDGDKGRHEECMEGLKSAGGFLRREIAHKVTLRLVPALEFYYDDSIEYGEHMDDIFEKLKEERRQKKDV